ncbi:MAG: cyclic nucleotide-binding domain-containing protein [Mariprofundaceae bacterium]
MAADYQDIFSRAREAAGKGNFELARKLFGELWKSPIWQSDKEVKLRYAYSCERTGDYTEALNAYKSLMETYNGMAGVEEGGEPALLEESTARMKELLAEGERDVEHRRVASGEQDAIAADLTDQLFCHAYERELPIGHALCTMNEVADHMWLLVEGEVEVRVLGQPPAYLTGTPSRPCLIGELAYFTGMRRAAALSCYSSVKLLELPYERIRQLIDTNVPLERMLGMLFRERLVLRVLTKHDIFKMINDVDRKQIAMDFNDVQSLPGDVLIQQGEEHEGMYMVQSGVMLLIHTSNEGKGELLGSMHPGDIFHLGGLLRGYIPSYSSETGSPARLLHLPRDRFEPLMANRPWLIQTILKRSRMAVEKQVLHPEAKNLWATDRYIDMKKS